MMLKTGDRFGKYTVERMLGTGGMGAVYLVRHSVLDSLCALKILDAATAQKGRDFVARFIREAKLASNICHPNLVAVHDAGQDEKTGLYYLVMDYLPGGTLRDRIHDRGRIPADEAVRIARQMAAALVTAHERGMVHRDIKPENIMFAADGSAKLVDLGIAKDGGGQDTLVTMASAVFGTPAYMAPEQATDSSSVDGRADIWSLGVVLYEMLSGERPYEGNGLGAIVKQLLSADPFPDVRAIAPDVPASLAELIGDMCRKDVSQRMSNARDLVARLSSVDCSMPVLQKNGVQPGAARTMVTMATEATIQSVPSAGEPSVFVEPKLPTYVRDFEEQREKKIRRAALRRRVAVAILVLICALVGTIAIFSSMREASVPVNQPGEVDPPPVPPPLPVPPPQTNEPPSEVHPTPQVADVYLVGVSSEEGGLRALSGGVGIFLPIAGKPDAIRGKIVEIMAQKPKVVYISLVGYAASREMSEARFDTFLRGMAGGFASGQTQVVLVAGATSYGRIVRAVAQEFSLDVVE